jgi:hypothetical protein
VGAATGNERADPSVVYIDESKVRDYLLVAVGLDRRELRTARAAITELILRGQSRLHMRKESDARRKLILSRIATLRLDVTVFRAPKDGRSDTVRRADCIRALVSSLPRDSATTLCFELDETLVRKDRQTIVEAVHSSGNAGSFAHRHATAVHEPLLALPDALGWAWAKGGDWRRRCDTEICVVDV